MHETSAPPGESAALDQFRRANARRAWRSTIVTALLVAAVGFLFKTGRLKLPTLLVHAPAEESGSLSPLIAYRVAAASADWEGVKMVCLAQANLGGQIEGRLNKTSVALRRSEAQRWMKKWEDLDDARNEIAEKPMPPEAKDLMVKCATLAARIGDYLETVGGPQDTDVDGSQLTPLVHSMKALLSGSGPR